MRGPRRALRGPRRGRVAAAGTADRSGWSAEHFAGDDELLDLAGALVDAEQADVAVEALDRDAAHVAGTAVDLHGAVGDAADGFAGEVLGSGRGQALVGARLVLVSGVQDQGPGGQVLGLGVGQHGLDELVVGDAVTALGAV